MRGHLGFNKRSDTQSNGGHLGLDKKYLGQKRVECIEGSDGSERSQQIKQRKRSSGHLGLNKKQGAWTLIRDWWKHFKCQLSEATWGLIRGSGSNEISAFSNTTQVNLWTVEGK